MPKFNPSVKKLVRSCFSLFSFAVASSLILLCLSHWRRLRFTSFQDKLASSFVHTELCNRIDYPFLFCSFRRTVFQGSPLAFSFPFWFISAQLGWFSSMIFFLFPPVLFHWQNQTYRVSRRWRNKEAISTLGSPQCSAVLSSRFLSWFGSRLVLRFARLTAFCFLLHYQASVTSDIFPLLLAAIILSSAFLLVLVSASSCLFWYSFFLFCLCSIVWVSGGGAFVICYFGVSLQAGQVSDWTARSWSECVRVICVSYSAFFRLIVVGLIFGLFICYPIMLFHSAGLETDLFYHLQALLFGNDLTVMTVAKKVMVDQFVYTLVCRIRSSAGPGDGWREGTAMSWWSEQLLYICPALPAFYQSATSFVVLTALFLFCVFFFSFVSSLLPCFGFSLLLFNVAFLSLSSCVPSSVPFSGSSLYARSCCSFSILLWLHLLFCVCVLLL